MFLYYLENPRKLVLLLLLFRLGSCDPVEVSSEGGVLVDEGIEINNEDESLSYEAITTTSVKFFLRTPPPDNKTIEINSTNHFLNATQPIKILIHGESESHHTEWVDNLVSIYHKKGGYNVVVVDWSKVSTTDSLFHAAAVNETGAVIAEFVMEVTQERVEGLKDVHLIGNGLGAHVGGVAGKNVHKKGNKVGRITGLDPERSKDKVEFALENDDAEFVDVIHTSTISGEDSCGTVDFYVLSNDIGTPICINGTCIVANEAHDFYSLSVLDGGRYQAVSCANATAYIADLCSDAERAVLGEYVTRNASGNYYLSPSSALPLSNNNQFLTFALAATVFYFMNN